ncbi:hypothetical protein [Nakamurella flava]|nr:hypothetical protein [Nakamurella flava]
MSDDTTTTAVSEDHKEALIDDKLPVEPEEVKEDVEDFPTE